MTGRYSEAAKLDVNPPRVCTTEGRTALFMELKLDSVAAPIKLFTFSARMALGAEVCYRPPNLTYRASNCMPISHVISTSGAS
jgi:hypothetical protein